jgi:hypothetical protein
MVSIRSPPDARLVSSDSGGRLLGDDLAAFIASFKPDLED